MLDVKYFLTAAGLTIVFSVTVICLILWEKVSRKTAEKLAKIVTTLGTAIVIWLLAVTFLHWWGGCYGTYSCWVWR